jgi:hypothetical protein
MRMLWKEGDMKRSVFLMRAVLAMLLAAATFNANANLQIWRFNTVNGAVGAFVYDTSDERITDWDIFTQGVDPFYGGSPIVGPLGFSIKNFNLHSRTAAESCVTRRPSFSLRSCASLQAQVHTHCHRWI